MFVNRKACFCENTVLVLYFLFQHFSLDFLTNDSSFIRSLKLEVRSGKGRRKIGEPQYLLIFCYVNYFFVK